MKIEKLTTKQLSIPYIDESKSDWTDQLGVQLYIKCDTDKVTGWGETLVGGGVVNSYRSVIEDLISKLISGETVQDVNVVTEKLEKSLFTAGLCGVANSAISGVDMALWDAYAKENAKSISDMIGGAKRGKIPVHATLPRYSSIDQLLIAVKNSISRGFTLIKLHQPPGMTIDSVREIRKKFGKEVGLAIDLNALYNVARGREFLHNIRRYEPEWVEEPLWPPNDYESLSLLTKNIDVPIAVGENEYSIYGFKRMIEAGTSVIQPDISRVGGLRHFLEIVELAKSFKVNIAPHLGIHRSAISFAVTLQVAAARPEITTVEHCLATYPSDIFTGLGKAVNGEVDLPGGYGLGIQINQSSFKRYKYHDGFRLLEFSDLQKPRGIA